MPVDDKVPNPGSEAAVRLGCFCSRMDNCHGKGMDFGDGKPNRFFADKRCPMHAEWEPQ